MEQQAVPMPEKPNPHMWIPYHGPEPWDEVCGLCGVFSSGHNKRPDPEAAHLPCPETWPEGTLTDEHLAALEKEAVYPEKHKGSPDDLPF